MPNASLSITLTSTTRGPRAATHLALLAMLATLSACGGGDATGVAPTPNPPAPTPPPPAPSEIVGVATPESVSVVTATNAG
jgi:hypothetical protein